MYFLYKLFGATLQWQSGHAGCCSHPGGPRINCTLSLRDPQDYPVYRPERRTGARQRDHLNGDKYDPVWNGNGYESSEDY